MTLPAAALQRDRKSYVRTDESNALVQFLKGYVDRFAVRAVWLFEFSDALDLECLW
jgi:hypothetical protein